MSDTSSKYITEVDQQKCIGAASCTAIASNTYQLNEQQKAQVVTQEADGDEQKLMAAQSCPAGAIKILDRSSKKLIWPKSS